MRRPGSDSRALDGLRAKIAEHKEVEAKLKEALAEIPRKI